MRRPASALVLVLMTLAIGAAGCGGDDGATGTTDETAITTETETSADTGAVDGGAVFASAGCGGCHTLAAAGSSGSVGPNLDDLQPDAATVEAQVRNGGGAMPAFEGQLSDQEIAAVATYVAESAGS
jgi:mono/diheme cytochrome c family protein